MKDIRDIKNIAQVEPGDHYCCLYETENECWSHVGALLLRRADQGKKVICVLDGSTASALRSCFSDERLEVGGLLEKGNMSILEAEGVLTAKAPFDPSGMMRWLHSETEQALTEGYSSLTVFVEMPWSLQWSWGTERLIEYEAGMNNFLPGKKCSVICGYDTRRFEPGLLLDVLTTHPIIIKGNEFLENFYHVPPAGFFGSNPSAARLGHYLNNLAENRRSEKGAWKTHSILEDIKEQAREQAEDSLKKPEIQLVDIINFLPDGTFAIDHEGRVIAWNHAIEEMSGIKAEDILGKGNYEHALAFYDTRRPTLIDLALESDKITEKEYTYILKEKNGLIAETDRPFIKGKKIHLWIKATPILDQKGHVVGAIESVRDITDRKRMEEERERLLLELQTKTRDMEQLLYVASHDLRSPLLNIQGFAGEMETSLTEALQALEKEGKQPCLKKKLSAILENDLHDSLAFIFSSSSKIDALITGLLRLSRLGRAALDIETLDVKRIVDDVLGAFEYHIKEKGIKLEVEDLPVCQGDETQINQVFSNLIDNAIKFIDPGRPGTIKVSGVKEAEHAIYCVEDNGKGIGEKNREKIFEIFYRQDPEATPGEGLGLTIIRRIIERHHGKVWIESESGRGSKFFFSLPAGEDTLRGGHI